MSQLRDVLPEMGRIIDKQEDTYHPKCAFCEKPLFTGGFIGPDGRTYFCECVECVEKAFSHFD